MLSTAITSRARLLAAMRGETLDHVPCSFMLYGGLKSTCQDYFQFVERQIEMGLDTVVELPIRAPIVVNDHYNLHGLPVSYDPSVRIQEWTENLPDSDLPRLVKEYQTPTGSLLVKVRKTDDWRWGDHVPFLDDYVVSRSEKFLVTEPEHLEALRYLLVPPSAEEIAAFRAEAAPALEMARSRQLLVTGGWGVGADLIGWICGLENMIVDAHERPAFTHELLELIARWNQRRMEVVLDIGIDLYIKRAWYENCDFWSPASWRKFIFPILKADAELAHSHGARFGYLITSRCMPLLDMIAEAGVDAVIGVDPREWDLVATRQKLGGRVCLWGGVNGHLTIEEGTEEQVRSEVRRAIETLAPGGGFILSPVDNVRQDTPHARANVQVMLDEWRRRRAGPVGGDR